MFDKSHLQHAFNRDVGRVIRKLHLDVKLSLEAWAGCLMHHRAPEKTDWAALQSELLAEAQAISMVGHIADIIHEASQPPGMCSAIAFASLVSQLAVMAV